MRTPVPEKATTTGTKGKGGQWASLQGIVSRIGCPDTRQWDFLDAHLSHRREQGQ